MKTTRGTAGIDYLNGKSKADNILGLDGDDVIGCLYIYPDKKGDSEAYVSSWVTASRAEMDVAVWRAVSDWLSADWPFRSFRYADRPT